MPEEEEELFEDEDEDMLKLRLYHERQQKLTIIKEHIASIAHEVLENPEQKVLEKILFSADTNNTTAEANGRIA